MPHFVYVTDHLYGEGGCVEPAPWVGRDHPALIAEAIDLQRRHNGELRIAGTPDAGHVSVLDDQRRPLMDTEWVTQTPLQAMGIAG